MTSDKLSSRKQSDDQVEQDCALLEPDLWGSDLLAAAKAARPYTVKQAQELQVAQVAKVAAVLAVRPLCAAPADVAGLEVILNQEERYLTDAVRHAHELNGPGIMPGDVEGVFHRIRAALSARADGWAELRALSKRATPGPWRWQTSNSWLRLGTDARGKDRSGIPYGQDGYVAYPYAPRSGCHPDLCIRNEADRDLIPAAVNFVLSLFTETREAR